MRDQPVFGAGCMLRVSTFGVAFYADAPPEDSSDYSNSGARIDEDAVVFATGLRAVHQRYKITHVVTLDGRMGWVYSQWLEPVNVG